MKRLRGGAPVAATLIAVAVFATAGADAKPKAKHRHGPSYLEPAARRPADFPTYIDHGADRNPGGDNLYFTDTKNPHYVIGPAWFQRWEDR